MTDYEITSHEGLGDITRELLDLTAAAFGDYDGVIAPTEEFQRWYTRRPGMTPASCFVAWAGGGRIVSNVYVTETDIRIGGEMLRVGLVDTVMTHPAHRRRGLATRVLTRAIEHMRDRALDAGMLYTQAGSLPYTFYRKLGYEPYAVVRYYKLPFDFRERRPLVRALGVPIRESTPDDGRALRAFLDETFAAHDGYTPQTEELWDWRRALRPDILPVEMLIAEGTHGVTATAALATATLRTSKGAALMTGIIDFAVRDPAPAPGFFAEVLRRAPRTGSLIILSGEVNTDFNAMCESFGFAQVMDEVAMVKPLSPRGEAAARRPPALWYTTTESLVGI